MIKPAISPRTITASATTGLISAAKSGVKNIKDITETISNEPEVTKEEKFGMNYVGFFGSKKVGKDLKKSMKTIRDSVGSTFGIAKALKESVTKGAGVFGFVGKLIGGAAMALPIFALLGIPLLKGILGIIAIGGIAGLLSTFGGQILDFVRDKASGFTKFIREVIGDFFISRKTDTEFQEIRESSDARIEAALESDTNKDRQQAVVDANRKEIEFLQAEKSEYEENNKYDKNYRATLKAYDDRIRQLQTGKLDLEKKPETRFGKFLDAITPGFLKRPDLLGKFATDITEDKVTLATPGEKTYSELTGQEKIESIRAILRNFGDREDINRARLLYEQEIKKGSLFGQKLSEDQLQQANDIIKYLETFGEDPLGDIDPKDKEEFLKKLSGVNINPRELSKKIPEGGNVGGTSGSLSTNNAGNVAVLPMGNKSSNQSLVRNDTGGLVDGPSMKIHPNFDVDNFIAPINMANFNIV